jgi:signal transduction histidine kinase
MLTTVTNELLRKKCVSYMQEAIANSSAILKRLVRFSKGDGEEFGPVPANEMLSSSVELLRRSVNSHTAVEYDERPEREYIRGNYYDLQNAVLNIGLNARDALPQSGGRIAVSSWTSDRNPLKPETACRWYNLSIRDNGCGMSSNVQRRIFDPFFTTKPKDMGSGLGLFTTHGNIQRHGGTISVESVQGEGTEFVLAFPLMEEGISEKDSQEAEAPAYSP